MIHQIVYSSEATKPMMPGDLENLLAHSRVANAGRDITGALVYVDGVFLQILEGAQDAVTGLMSRIEHDPRHRSVKVFFSAQAPQRTFGSWSMAYVDAKPEQIAAWAGLQGAAAVETIIEDIGRSPNRLADFVGGILKAISA